MRIAIDGQTFASPDATRGIGVYLSNLLAHLPADHEYRLLLWGPEPEALRTPPSLQTLRLMPSPIAISSSRSETYIARNSALRKAIRTTDCQVLFNPNSLQPSVEAVARISNIPLVATIHDLTPLALPKLFFPRGKEQFEAFYRDRIRHVASHADIIITDSAATREDVIKHLKINPDRVTVVYCGVHEQYRHPINEDYQATLLDSLGLTEYTGRFLLSVGGYNPKKNIPALIRALGRLEIDIIRDHPLIFAGPIDNQEWQELKAVRDQDAPALQMMRLGYVTDTELHLLYSSAGLLPFVSLHEGFGLPVVEAMAAGCPVVTSNTSSLPEVAGDAAILCDPTDEDSIAEAIGQVLRSADLQNELRAKGKKQSESFSWDRAALDTVAALERATELRSSSRPSEERIPSLAWFSPLPPDAGGVSIYSYSLLEHLQARYSITVIYQREKYVFPDTWNVKQLHESDFSPDEQSYDLCVYHMGNNVTQCEHTYKWLSRVPGLVVLHDINIHGFLLDLHVRRGNSKAKNESEAAKEPYWQELEIAHGSAGAAVARHVLMEYGLPPIHQFPCHSLITGRSHAVVVHSQWSREQLENNADPADIFDISLGIELPLPINREQVNALLESVQKADDELLLVTAGFLEPSRRVDKILHAMGLLKQRGIKCRLLAAGNVEKNHLAWLKSVAEQFGISEQVSWRGYMTHDDEFLACLAVADLVIHLRYPTNGENSATVLRALSLGKPVLVSNNDSYQELPDDCCWKVDADQFEIPLIVEYIAELASSPDLRQAMSSHAVKRIQQRHQWIDVVDDFERIITQVIAAHGTEKTSNTPQIAEMP